MPYPGRRGGAIPALHGSYTYAGARGEGGVRAPTRSDQARRTTMRRIARAPREPPRGSRKAKRSGAPEGPALHLYGSAVHRSAAPCSPTGFPRSTIGARRLSFRVRNGSGRAPPAMAADRWAALRPPRGGYVCPGGPSCPGGRTARRWTLGPGIRSDRKHRAAPMGAHVEMMRVRARAISAARLRPSPTLHLRPIDQVFYLGPYQKEN